MSEWQFDESAVVLVAVVERVLEAVGRARGGDDRAHGRAVTPGHQPGSGAYGIRRDAVLEKKKIASRDTIKLARLLLTAVQAERFASHDRQFFLSYFDDLRTIGWLKRPWEPPGSRRKGTLPLLLLSALRLALLLPMSAHPCKSSRSLRLHTGKAALHKLLLLLLP